MPRLPPRRWISGENFKPACMNARSGFAAPISGSPVKSPAWEETVSSNRATCTAPANGATDGWLPVAYRFFDRSSTQTLYLEFKTRTPFRKLQLAASRWSFGRPTRVDFPPHRPAAEIAGERCWMFTAPCDRSSQGQRRRRCMRDESRRRPQLVGRERDQGSPAWRVNRMGRQKSWRVALSSLSRVSRPRWTAKSSGNPLHA